MTDSLTSQPRRPVLRAVLRRLIALSFGVLARFEINGLENLPAQGPLLLIGNHFSFIDPVAVIHCMPWPVDFVGGLRMPNAPPFVRWIPAMWGVLPVRRGSLSRDTLLAARNLLKGQGRLAIFPEAGSWATVLRPARPGAAFLASSSRAQIVPIGLDGLVELFPGVRKGRRGSVRVNIGKPFGPLYVSERGEKDRACLDEIGHEMMRRIAALIPPERRGFYSDNPVIRAAAQGTEIYPWADRQEV